MSEHECGEVRELIPDFVSGRLASEERKPLEAHLASCEACADEAELARVLLVTRRPAPAGLAGRIRRAVAADRVRPRAWWGLSAAAVAAVALGIGIASERAPEESASVPHFAYEAVEGGLWSSEDGIVAGAPLLDGLDEEALTQLLDELSTGGAGGSA